MNNFIRIPSFLICLFFIGITSDSYAQLSKPLPFMTEFTPKSAVILNYKNIQRKDIPAALVRLPNNKIAFMVRQENKLAPFYIKGIETGYWDTRYEKDTNYDSVFNDMVSMGANTAFIMIHWEDIESSDNHFDFSFTDSLVSAAARQKIKINWILFLHAQSRVPSMTPETAWTFHLDDRDTSNYTMQWVKRDNVIYTNIQSVLKHAVRPLHVYGHPEIFYRIRRMVYNLAVHYKQSETVIGVQLGNEEGFSFIDESDFNPVTEQLYEEWKLKTNKESYAEFKREAMNWWWQQFTSAYHEGDPYKILSLNLDAGQAEAGDKKRVEESGTDAGTYADGNLDAIGTMFYKNWGYKAILGLDKRYGNSYNYKLPVLIPSEIGIGRFNPSVYFRQFLVNSLERAAQGFGVYCYGEIRKELIDKKDVRDDFINMVKMITANEKIIYGGLPGPGTVTVTTGNDEAKVSHLNLNKKETLAIVYFPDAKINADSVFNRETFTLKINISGVVKNGRVHILKNGKEIVNKNISIRDTHKPEIISVENVTGEDILFIYVDPKQYAFMPG